MSDKALSEEFEKELSKLKNNEVFSIEHRKKKIITYAIRTVIAIILYIIFWKHQWIRWSLFLFLPLNLFFLLSIFGWSYFLNRKIESTKNKIKYLTQEK